jgi:NADPH2:quinone reductase
VKAVRIHTLDGPRAVKLDEIAEPLAGPKQVLIRVRSLGLTFPEVLQTRGLYQVRPDPPFVPGSQVAGEIISAPEDSGFRTGDRVAALPVLGGLAEVAVAEVDLTYPLPEYLTFDEGCTIPLNYFTAHVALKYRGRLSRGESVLVHGAAGGVGSAAVQIAKALGAGRVVAVVSSDEKAAAARAAGADECVPVENFREAVLVTGKVDIVFDPVGGERFTDSLRCLDSEGRLLVVGFTSGVIPEVKVNRLLLNNLEVVGVSWGGYSRARPGFTISQWDELMTFARDGAVKPLIAAALPLDRVIEGLELIDERRVIGTVVVNP